MIAVDASVLVAWMALEKATDTARVDTLSVSGEGALAAVTLTELLSNPKGSGVLHPALVAFPLLPILDGYWERAGLLRSKVIKSGRKAALGDALIAQACIDSDVPLLTRDADFKTFAKLGGLKLA